MPIAPPVLPPSLHRRAILAGGLASAVAGGAAMTLVPSQLAARPGTSPSGALSRAGTSSRPRRIVSLNPCLDVILLRVADPEQIGALSPYSRDRYGSTIAERARDFATTRGTTEELVALSPDLVLANLWGGDRTAAALIRAGIPAERFDVPETVTDSLDQVLQIARLVGHPERGEALVRSIATTLAQSAPRPGEQPVTALVFMPGGFASGPGTLMDEMMQRAGLVNVAARYGLTGSMPVPLERLIADPPELLLTGEAYPGSPGWSQRTLHHPALARLAPVMRRAVFPERLLFCGGPVLMQSARTLAAARRSVLKARS